MCFVLFCWFHHIAHVPCDQFYWRQAKRERTFGKYFSSEIEYELIYSPLYTQVSTNYNSNTIGYCSYNNGAKRINFQR